MQTKKNLHVGQGFQCTASAIKCYWGKDLSGTLQGAGGVGGLLYLTVDGSIHVPCYDHNGNVTRYLDANGSTVAQYTYNAFDWTISQTGSLADFFRHRFSTKYFDADSGLYYYGHRFYSPILRRWLTRDPIEEDGGVNLYVFCENNSICHIDLLGYSAFDYLPFILVNHTCSDRKLSRTCSWKCTYRLFIRFAK